MAFTDAPLQFLPNLQSPQSTEGKEIPYFLLLLKEEETKE